MTDPEIISHLRNDQYSLAVKGVYKYFSEARKYILNNSGTTADAQDIFQDALVILYRKVREDQWVLSSSLKAYLMGVVRNCWYNELRYRNKTSTTTLDTDIADIPKTDEENYLLAKLSFNQLGEKCKQLLMMFYHQQQNFKVIAETLGFSDEKIAKNQKYRCLQKAKEYYSMLSK
jgi:RNA polymerase sigma factor (sigma-70 family)